MFLTRNCTKESEVEKSNTPKDYWEKDIHSQFTKNDNELLKEKEKQKSTSLII